MSFNGMTRLPWQPTLMSLLLELRVNATVQRLRSSFVDVSGSPVGRLLLIQIIKQILKLCFQNIIIILKSSL